MPLFEDKDEDGNYLDTEVLTLHIVPPGELHLFLGKISQYLIMPMVWSLENIGVQ